MIASQTWFYDLENSNQFSNKKFGLVNIALNNKRIDQHFLSLNFVVFMVCFF